MAKNNKFKEYDNLNLTQIAAEELAFWEGENIFEKSINSKDPNQSFVFYEGPPSANGKPGIHHVLSRAIKDIFCRYQTLKGKQVRRKAGWDTHGLPVELGVEKELGITKEDIGHKISIEEYNEACKKAVMKYTDLWNDLTKKMGYWVNLDDPYITYESKYMETVWWLLKQIYNKDLLYKGYTIQPYSPKAGTGLSSHELNMPGTYKDVTDTTIVAQFKVSEDPNRLFEDTQDNYLLAWTTTPWTLPSNTALTVGNKIDYLWVKTFNQYTFEPIKAVIAESLLNKQFDKKFQRVENQEEFDALAHSIQEKNGKIPFLVLKRMKGADLVGIKYEQLLPWATPDAGVEKAFRVIPGDFVTTEDGTGIVHTAPTFGADDAKVAMENEVPPMLVKNSEDELVPLVDLQGKFIEELPQPYGGKYVKNEYYTDEEAPEKSIDVQIAILLKEENKAFKVEKYKHTYPHCWRTDKPILYYPLDSWFIKITSVKERLVELNQTIHWKPASTGIGRFGNWLENANDWNLSRSRYWGVPLPIWRTEDGKEEKIIGSVEELINEINQSIEKGFMKVNPYADFVVNDFSEENYQKVDLHKHIVDEIVLVSPSGKAMHRESDLIDVWFDSGAMPYAQWHYPFENKELIDQNKAFPADFIAEGVDQTRGWFYTLHAIGTMVFDQIAYKNVIANGLVLDKDGQKMSKRLGNTVDPFNTLEKYGPDATRWYMISNAQPWDNLKFDLNGLDDVRKKFFGTLYNTYSFFALYANIDEFNGSEVQIPLENRTELDQWIISELHTLIQKVDEFYTDYEPTRAARAIQDFTLDYLSNWYVRLNRRRFWKGDYSEDKVAAYQTLYEVLETIAILSAPIAPFFMDRLYKDLSTVVGEGKAESVHLADFPSFNTAYINNELQEKTHLAQRLVSMVFSIRKKENIRVRQPLKKLMIPILDDKMKQDLIAITPLLKQEVNVKEVEMMDKEEAANVLVRRIKPNFATLGPKFGKDMKLIAKATGQLKQEDIVALEENGELTLKDGENSWDLTLEDFDITIDDIPGKSVATNGKYILALDLEIDDDLKAEGIARELVNRIQNERKEQDFEVTDQIIVYLESNEWLEKAVNENKEYIKNETLAQDIRLVDQAEKSKSIEIEDFSTQLAIEKFRKN